MQYPIFQILSSLTKVVSASGEVFLLSQNVLASSAALRVSVAIPDTVNHSSNPAHFLTWPTCHITNQSKPNHSLPSQECASEVVHLRALAKLFYRPIENSFFPTNVRQEKTIWDTSLFWFGKRSISQECRATCTASYTLWTSATHPPLTLQHSNNINIKIYKSSF